MRRPVLLAILDGFGIAPPGPGNAVASADTPFLDELLSGKIYPLRTLTASGRDVGLPDGQMGNSEVGHLNIGAGRVVNQELTRIDSAIKDGSFEHNPVLIAALDEAIAQGATVHLMGLLSDGGVHSSVGHLEALVRMAVARGARTVRVHAFMDGRDVSPTSGVGFIEHIDTLCRELSAIPGSNDDSGSGTADVRIASIIGRYYAMDRDNRWDRVEKAWRTLVVPVVEGADRGTAADPVQVVRDSYGDGITDEFIEPVSLDEKGVSDGDALIFFNFRPDRAREITRAFIDQDFDRFIRPVVPKVHFVCMTEYDVTFDVDVAFPKSFPENVLADYLAANGLRQLHIAETEKYAHVTFFLNGGIEEPKQGEARVLVPSPKVATYDLQPQMSAPEVTDSLVDAIEHDEADVYIVNYANCDMVGHTGSFPAAVSAVEAVDRGLKRVIDALASKQGVALVTADHGNAEKMIDQTGAPFTAHTLSPVPLVLVDGSLEHEGSLKSIPAEETLGLVPDSEVAGRLADIAPTLVDIMGLAIPQQWTGRSLLVRNGTTSV